MSSKREHALLRPAHGKRQAPAFRAEEKRGRSLQARAKSESEIQREKNGHQFSFGRKSQSVRLSKTHSSPDESGTAKATISNIKQVKINER